MRLIDRAHRPLRPGRCSRQPSGAVLIALIIAITLIATLGAAMYTLSSSGTYGSLSANLATRAYYAAESGYRYAVSKLRNEGDLDDKIICLQDLHDDPRTTLPNSLGSFSISIYPFFFITTDPATVGDNYLSVKTPGEFPSNFTVPGTIQIKVDNRIYDATLNAQTPPADVSFQVDAGLLEDVPAGTIVCLMTTTSGAQTLTAGDDLTLSGDASSFFPEKNGRIDVDGQTYSYKTSGVSGSETTLTGLQGADSNAQAALPLDIPNGDNVTLPPILRMVVTGTIADVLGGSRKITYILPLTIGGTGLPENELLLIDNFPNLDNWSTTATDIETDHPHKTNWGNKKSGVLLGGASPPGVGRGGGGRGGGGPSITSIFLLLDMPAELEAAWQDGDYHLSYDVQIKHKWDEGLTAAADGINVRWHDPHGTGKYQGFGVSFMCYSGIGAGSTDDIPDSIKPPGLADVPLLVLWEQRISGGIETRRWIAYKDLTNPTEDTYVLGGQTAKDGQVFNDLSSLFVRVEEDSTSSIKTNTLKVFYGDASTLASRANVVGNDVSTDRNRWLYPPSWSTGSPGILWPVNNIADWAQGNDYMTFVAWDGTNATAVGYSLDVYQTSVSTTNFVTPDDVFSDRNEIALHAFGDLSDTILFDDFGAQILKPSSGQTGGFGIPLQQ